MLAGNTGTIEATGALLPLYYHDATTLPAVVVVVFPRLLSDFTAGIISGNRHYY